MTVASQHLDHHHPIRNPSGAIEDIDATIAGWRSYGVTADVAWQLLGGTAGTRIGWAPVRKRMLRIALERRIRVLPEPRPQVPPLRFADDPAAIRDHGSPGRVDRPPTWTQRPAA
jgi:hypothetical protein